MPEALSNCPSLQEILWNFCRSQNEMECLTLKMNPHFYAELPTLSGPEPYGEFFGDGVKIDPTEDFQHSNKFYVLTDRPDFVYIMTDQDLRPFGNFWCAKNAIIFKGLGNPVRFPPLLLTSCQISVGGSWGGASSRHPSEAHIVASVSGSRCPPFQEPPGTVNCGRFSHKCTRQYGIV